MKLLSWRNAKKQSPFLYGENVYLRIPTINDFEEWKELRIKSRSFLQPFEPSWPENSLDRSYFTKRLRQQLAHFHAGNCVPFFIYSKLDNALVGGLTLGNIRVNFAKCAALGYWLGVDKTGNGYMHHAIKSTLPYIFNNLKLNRVEATCMPTNQPSIAVLTRLNFQKEGYMRDYLQINGAWRDHLLYSYIKNDYIGISRDDFAPIVEKK